KTVMAEKFLRDVLRPVGQQRNAKEIFLFGKIDRMLEKLGTVTLALVLLVDHQIFQQNNKAALSGADSKQQIDHPHDRPVSPQDKDAAPAGLFENQTQTTKLFFLVRTEIAFLG